MKPRTLMCITAAVLFAALAMVVQVGAQQQDASHPRYKLIDLGTFGGPNAVVNGPGTQDLTNQGTYAGEADTSIPDPFAPNCIPFDPECLVQHAQEWQNGAVIDLGTLPGVNNSGATWISANGRFISGASENGLIDPLLGVPEVRAVVWKDGQIMDLGTLGGGYESFATAVNSRGQVVGVSANTIPDPFSLFCFIACLTTQTRTFLSQDGVMQDLGTLGGPDAFTFVVNERGQITGFSYTDSTPNPTTGIPTIDPFFWERGTMTDVGTLGGTIGMPNYMNSRGQVVGTSNLAGDQTHHPFLWDGGSLKDLGTLGGVNGEAFWISDSRLVAGRADFSALSTDHHAFLWKNGAMTDLGVVDPFPCSTAYSVNSTGQVVGDTGVCGQGGGPSFFSEHGGPMVDLNTLVLPGSDIEVVDAFQINDRGEIAGGGILPNGDFHAVLLVPADQGQIAAAGTAPNHVASRPATAGRPRPTTSTPAWPAAPWLRGLTRSRRLP